jgi:hypothetical protein
MSDSPGTNLIAWWDSALASLRRRERGIGPLAVVTKCAREMLNAWSTSQGHNLTCADAIARMAEVLLSVGMTPGQAVLDVFAEGWSEEAATAPALSTPSQEHFHERYEPTLFR